MNTQTSNIVFLDAAGRVLARGLLPEEAFIEGPHGTVKDFDVDFRVIADGKLDHYICQTPNGEPLTGAIIEKRGNYAREMLLDVVDVKTGQHIRGKWQIESVKD